MKYKIFTVTALTGGALAELFGGWDKALQTLLIFMIVDWITGGILLPVVFGRSPKSPNGLNTLLDLAEQQEQICTGILV